MANGLFPIKTDYWSFCRGAFEFYPALETNGSTEMKRCTADKVVINDASSANLVMRKRIDPFLVRSSFVPRSFLVRSRQLSS